MFRQLVLFTYNGTLELDLGKEVRVQIQLNEHEQDQLRAMCERFYAERQRDISDLALAPLPQLAHYEEVDPF